MSFDIANDGKLKNPSKTVSTNGICPCHLAVTEKDIYVVNYLSGNIVSTSGNESIHTGSGKIMPRQDTAHTHFVNLSPDKKYLLSCDLGLDSIYTYDFDLNVKSVAKVESGEGARHLAYSSDGKYVYCVNELGSSLSVFKYDNGNLNLCNTYSCILENTNENTAAAIRYNNGFVYVSNRGEDTIVSFKADADKLTLVSRTSVEGSSPRDFDFCEDYIICANEKTNNVTVFSVQKGKLIRTDEVTNIATRCVSL